MKTVKAVAPYIYSNSINFKQKPYEAWVEIGGHVAKAHYPIRAFHGIFFRYELPVLWKNKKYARLRFVQPWSIEFDTFPDYAFYEIIPLFWDVWPENFEKTFLWLRKHDIRTAIFTSSQVAEIVREKFPIMNVLSITEGIDVMTYNKGEALVDRKIDLLEYGREIDHVVKYNLPNTVNYVKGKKNGKTIFSHEELINNLADTKIVAAYPQNWTNPQKAGNIETLTQRYWECMLSRCVMVGHAPKELIDIIGYNPVIEVNLSNPDYQINDVLSNIKDYQLLVDKNWDSANKYGNWKYSIHKIIRFLRNCGYKT